ncbi:ABC-three component system protein [Streptomyces sp. NPDC059104]|uniref:ABC-three component system protein n=1 Tax=Streptomyces sp. NPDC059104 TaxID=3346729 RepID=UPI0036AA55B6
MADTGEQFEASASAFGYLFQFAKALHICIEQWMSGDMAWNVAVEAADDIEIHQGAGDRRLIQLKQRAEGVRMTDLSEDLWKTLRIWAEAAKADRIVLAETRLFLLTTAEIPEGSAAFYLPPRGSQHRDEERALHLLREARKASKATKGPLPKCFEAFDNLDQGDRPLQSPLMSRIEILSGTPDINEVRNALQGLAAFAVGHEAAQAFLARLEGWFYNRVIEQMQTPGGRPVTGSEFDEMLSDLQRQFRYDSLPIDPDISDMSFDPSQAVDQQFVRQLGLIGVGSERIELAVRDYVRAFTQRSRWSGENLLRAGELGKYERKLVEEWRSRFAEMAEELGPEVTEEEKKKEARRIYRWVDLEARFPIRSGCDESFVTKGSYHMLADELKVGWHPDYSARLIALLEPARTR